MAVDLLCLSWWSDDLFDSYSGWRSAESFDFPNDCWVVTGTFDDSFGDVSVPAVLSLELKELEYLIRLRMVLHRLGYVSFVRSLYLTGCLHQQVLVVL